MDAPRAQEALTIFHLTVPDKATLTARYLPFFRQGGLLVHSLHELALCTPVFLLLELPDQDEALACTGNIGLIQQNDHAGFMYGIQFSTNDNVVNETIKKTLTRMPTAKPRWQTFLFT